MHIQYLFFIKVRHRVQTLFLFTIAHKTTKSLCNRSAAVGNICGLDISNETIAIIKYNFLPALPDIPSWFVCIIDSHLFMVFNHRGSVSSWETGLKTRTNERLFPVITSLRVFVIKFYHLYFMVLGICYLFPCFNYIAQGSFTIIHSFVP